MPATKSKKSSPIENEGALPISTPITALPKNYLATLPRPILTIIAAFLVVALSGMGYFFYKYQTAQNLLQNPSAAAEKEVTGLIKKVNRLMQLPDKEKPTVATVSDIQKLKNQAFFANAKNGDKVLIYTQAKKAILYRPSINKIIEVAPINLGDQTANAQTAPGKVAGVDTQVVKPTTIPVSVVIYNGSGTSGKAKSMETGLKAKFAGLNVKETGNAKKSDYTQNLVIDISGKHQKEAEQIAKEINAQISILPEGENRPDADLLVIVGR